YVMAGKEPIRFAGVNLIGLRRRGYSNELIQLIHEAYRLLYSKGVLAEGIEEIKKNIQVTPEIQYIIDFVSTSKRGIIR
ncbi:MAG: acyl-[Prevotella sp.]|nr:acyl-[acyl-carrier-protein]--UDP-N-acetylglucosamine O-acyltransferase [Prevotella sp.]